VSSKLKEGAIGFFISFVGLLGLAWAIYAIAPVISPLSAHQRTGEALSIMRLTILDVAKTWSVILLVYWAACVAICKRGMLRIRLANIVLIVAFLANFAIWLDANFWTFDHMLLLCGTLSPREEVVLAQHEAYFPAFCFRGMLAYRTVDLMMLGLPFVSLFLRAKASRSVPS
jgi:hypothetical protein